MVTAKQGPAQAGPLADRPSSGDFNPPPHGYTVNSTSTIVYENGYKLPLESDAENSSLGGTRLHAGTKGGQQALLLKLA